MIIARSAALDIVVRQTSPRGEEYFVYSEDVWKGTAVPGQDNSLTVGKGPSYIVVKQ